MQHFRPLHDIHVSFDTCGNVTSDVACDNCTVHKLGRASPNTWTCGELARGHRGSCAEHVSRTNRSRPFNDGDPNDLADQASSWKPSASNSSTRMEVAPASGCVSEFKRRRKIRGGDGRGFAGQHRAGADVCSDRPQERSGSQAATKNVSIPDLLKRIVSFILGPERILTKFRRRLHDGMSTRTSSTTACTFENDARDAVVVIAQKDLPRQRRTS